MATFNKVNTFPLDRAHGVHDFETDQLAVALTNTAPVATNTVLANLTSVIPNTNLGGAGAFNLTTSSSSQTSGTYKLVIADKVLTATGSAGPFRYVAIYNDTAANDELLGWYDYGSSITMANGETFTIDFDGTNGLFTDT